MTMLLLSERRPATIALILGGVMSAVFVALVVRYDHDLRTVIHEKMVRRDAAVLASVAQQEVETGTFEPGGSSTGWLAALLPAAHRQGLLAMAVFDADGVLLERIPADQIPAELPADDFVRLQNGQPLTRYWPAFSLVTILAAGPREPTPVLEIVVPLRRKDSGASNRAKDSLIGFVRYHLDARAMANELATLDAGVRRQTAATLAVGLAALGLLVGAAYTLLARAQGTIAERSARLQRANLELTLAAKTSALGQLTSHLVHGLQGSVAGLRMLTAARENVTAADWTVAAGYADQMQVMIEEIVGLLGDRASATGYELTGLELASIVRRRNAASATSKGVELEVTGGFPGDFDSHRGGILCLIAGNLVQNAIEASAPSGKVTVSFQRDATGVTLVVKDTGSGISPEVRAHLFEPGHSGRPGGTGLGLAISQLLARQIGASLVLEASCADGTIFRVTVPIEPGVTTDPTAAPS